MRLFFSSISEYFNVVPSKRRGKNLNFKLPKSLHGHYPSEWEKEKRNPVSREPRTGNTLPAASAHLSLPSLPCPSRVSPGSSELHFTDEGSDFLNICILFPR